ncbi:BOLA class I histocompatibility antigen, alpha chain BL3-7-like [Hemibagrus wyckioides]|uniref:BOLA class I histocompatibility antigen, alpha chain BL3-7-like n=1 Tax=Hemibagrus wyckioides TaxID=337641 RepID=UPI00266B813B|nr:BOLA class I histocompatibility antigen, alpha chain BL3-7-like [Hemibagrus wyckioides]
MTKGSCQRVDVHRAPLTRKFSDLSSMEEDVNTHVNLIVESLPVSDQKLKQIAEETAKDPVLQADVDNLNNDWVKSFCVHFYNVKSELSMADGNGPHSCPNESSALLLRYFSSAVTHSLQYLYTGVTGINFPELSVIGLVDGEHFMYYDSDTRKVIVKTEWKEKFDDDHWNRMTYFYQGQQDWFKENMAKAMQSFNQTKGVHMMQFMYGCELHDDGTTRGYSQYGYDGEDFVSLDLKTFSWTAAKQHTMIKENKWDSKGHQAQRCKDFLKYGCIERLQKFVNYGRDILERKDPPTASVIQKHSPSPEVVCHATGFFPKAVNITWRKDGEDVNEDVELRETLPNQDGSFQKRSILKVPAEDLQKHTYTCVIQHSSLKEELVLNVRNECRILTGGGSDEAQIVIIVGVVMTLVALIAGIIIWKKKNSALLLLFPLSFTSVHGVFFSPQLRFPDHHSYS